MAVAFLFAALAAIAGTAGSARCRAGLHVHVFATGAAAMAFPTVFVAWGGFELKRTIVPWSSSSCSAWGMTLTFDDFARVMRMPKAIILGITLQFLVMPLGGYLAARLFGLRGEVRRV
jgi:BASS family bile acid:Na+ symporter